jgi:hypothetical protein
VATTTDPTINALGFDDALAELQRTVAELRERLRTFPTEPLAAARRRENRPDGQLLGH